MPTLFNKNHYGLINNASSKISLLEDTPKQLESMTSNFLYSLIQCGKKLDALLSSNDFLEISPKRKKFFIYGRRFKIILNDLEFIAAWQAAETAITNFLLAAEEYKKAVIKAHYYIDESEGNLIAESFSDAITICVDILKDKAFLPNDKKIKFKAWNDTLENDEFYKKLFTSISPSSLLSF